MLGRRGLDSSGTGYGKVMGCSKYDKEPSHSIIFWEFLDWVGNY